MAKQSLRKKKERYEKLLEETRLKMDEIFAKYFPNDIKVERPKTRDIGDSTEDV